MVSNKEAKAAEAQLPKNFLYKLKLKWGLDSMYQVFAILIVFTVTGSTVVFLRKSLFGVLGFDDTTALWIKTIVYIAFMLPAYQGLLLLYGSLLGQFEFFWNKEKKMFYAIKKLFTRSSS